MIIALTLLKSPRKRVPSLLVNPFVFLPCLRVVVHVLQLKKPRLLTTIRCAEVLLVIHAQTREPEPETSHESVSQEQ
jgi:hypothetical protein